MNLSDRVCWDDSEAMQDHCKIYLYSTASPFWSLKILNDSNPWFTTEASYLAGYPSPIPASIGLLTDSMHFIKIITGDLGYISLFL